MVRKFSGESAPATQQSRRLRIRAEEIRLLYGNTAIVAGVTVAAATILSYFQREVIPHQVVVAWWAYMVAVSAGRVVLARLHSRDAKRARTSAGWGTAFAIGAALAGTGWGVAGVLLYSGANLVNQVLLVFVLGGMMLGGSALLAPRPEAFLAFLVPTGVGPALRLITHGDLTHVGMGLLALIFTAAIVASTWRVHCAIDAALALQFRNRDLLEEVRAAQAQTEALNRELELRVRERTTELREANDRLRGEIEQRARMEDELLRTRKLESIGVLAGGIAHDFNNFLTIIQGNAEMLRVQLEPGGPAGEILDEIEQSCRRAAFLSSQLLTFAKGGAPVRRLVFVDKLIVDAVRLARAGTSISFDVEIAEDLLCADVDPSQIGQVLYNILLNARHAVPGGGIIEVRATNVLDDGPEPRPRVRISIRDYGCGIPDDILPRIFDPYFTTKPGSSGLGLATAYAIVQKHGGRIDVESTPGRGTLFIIELPASLERPAQEAHGRGAAAHGRMERLLVMDDEPAIRKLLEAVLSKAGYRVQSARDGAEAVALYEAAMESGLGFNAVLLDLTVAGGMGGIEAAGKIRELDQSARLIVSSGYSDSAVMSDYRQYGFDDVVPKPWAPEQLIEVFQRVLVAAPDRRSP